MIDLLMLIAVFGLYFAAQALAGFAVYLLARRAKWWD